MNMLKCGFIGEAVQIKKIIFLLLLIPSVIFSQDFSELRSMSDADLNMYWIQAQEEGYSLDQLKTIAKAQGVSDLEIAELEKRIINLGTLFPDKNSSNETPGNQSSRQYTSNFGLNENQELKTPDLTVFGSSFFNNPNISSVPSLNIATPESYELGPGDELAISIWGAAQNEYNSKITREGYLKIERIGPVYLSGLSISEAKMKLKNRLSKIYSGINSNYNKVFFDITLLNSRSIVINITGNVVAPGTYTLSSLTSLLNALYAAGGPNEIGSYREIKIIRGGKEIRSLDLYDYFVKGALKNFSLRDQDIILVPSYKKRIVLIGEFKTKGLFELKDNESVSNLLIYNGGVTSSGVKNTVWINRVEGVHKRIETVEKENFEEYILKDGDIIEARAVGDEIKNAVSVEGEVIIPGQYELDKNLDVRTLIGSASGLTESAFNRRAYIFRSDNGVENKVLSIDLENVLSGRQVVNLKPNDRLVISSNKSLAREKTINIRGQVFEPNKYPFFDGMTLIDLILIAKGVTLDGDLTNIEVYRSTYDKTRQEPVKGIKVNLNTNDLSNLNSENNILLKEDDLVIIRKKKGVQEKEFVFVNGLVANPGGYSIRTNNYSFYDLVKDFGGFLPDASLDGVKIKRRIDHESEINEIKISELDSINIEKDEEEKIEFIEFGVDLKKILSSNGENDNVNVVLKNGDQISVPKIDNSVELSGEIQKPSVLTYYKSLTVRRAITNSGGFKETARKKGVYVVYQNGDVSSTKTFLFFTKYPKLSPGSKIIVPKKIETEGKAIVAEIVGYTTSLVSIIALIKSF